MGRYVNEIPVNVDPNVFTQGISQFMQSEGFSLVDYNGQQLWKKGIGMLTAPQYMMVLYSPGKVRIEAFIRMAILPGVYVGEYGIDGMLFVIPKKLLAERVRAVERFIQSSWTAPAQ